MQENINQINPIISFTLFRFANFGIKRTIFFEGILNFCYATSLFFDTETLLLTVADSPTVTLLLLYNFSMKLIVSSI
jgi:hypothetical protein